MYCTYCPQTTFHDENGLPCQRLLLLFLCTCQKIISSKGLNYYKKHKKDYLIILPDTHYYHAKGIDGIKLLIFKYN